jgi:hypothetical protein
MKNLILIALLSFGLIAASGLSASAQEIYGPKAEKKEWKMHKKESKIGRKMWRDRQAGASRKRYKARKKSWKMEMKEEMDR